MTSLCPDVDIGRKILRSGLGSVLIVNSRIQCVSSAQMLKLTLQDHIRIKPVPRCLLRSLNFTSRCRCADVDIDREFSLHSGVSYSGALTIIGFTIRGSYNQGFLQSGVLQSGGLTISGSYNLGFLQSRVLTIRGYYNQGFLQSGVYISVSYMTHLCPVIDIDRCSLYSGVQMKVSYMTGLWDSYNQGFLRSGVLTIRGSNEHVLHDESMPRC